MTPEEFNKFTQQHQKDVDEFLNNAKQISKDGKEISKMMGF